MENKNDNIEAENNSNINYDILNALNLYNEDLGQSYLQDGFNPFSADFVLDEDFISNILDNQKNKKDLPIPTFLEQSNGKISKAFDMSLNNALNLLESVSQMLNAPNLTQKQKSYLNEILLQIKLFIELNKKYKLELKKKKNKYQLYINMLALNWQLSEEMSLIFTEQYNAQQLLNKIQELSTKVANKEIDEIKEQARKIIENNKKLYGQKENIINTNQVTTKEIVNESTQLNNEQKTTKEPQPNKYQDFLNTLKKENTATKIQTSVYKQTSNNSDNLKDDGMGR